MKKILLVTDVYNWGGHVRAQYIKKHLSDEFYFDIIDGAGFEQMWKFGVIQNKHVLLEYYDLIYLLFHTMLLRKDVKELLGRNGKKILTIVTAYPVLRAGFRCDPKMFLKRANKCIGIIANNYKSLADLKSIYEGKTWYAPRGVDENIFYPTRGFEEKDPDDFTVAFVGKEQNHEKGFLDFIKPACQEAGVKLIDNQRNYTDALTPDEMREFYNQADVYMVASIMDGTPNTALEAAACGLPLVANHIGNMPELIENHKNGWLVDEREIFRYANRLRWMKTHQRTAWEVGQRGRETVLRDWTWKNVLNKHERLIFREILNEV